MPTIEQTLIAALQERGYTIVQARDRLHKRTLLYKPGSASCAFVWVGRNGAARFNGVKRVDGSIPFSDRSRAILLGGRKDNLNATAI